MPFSAYADNYLQWTFQNATYSDGSGLTGSFTEDTTTGVLTSWNVTTAAGWFPLPVGFTYGSFGGFNYTPSDSTGGSIGLNALSILSNSPQSSYAGGYPYLQIAFQQPLNSVSTNNQISTTSYECNYCGEVRYISAVYVVSSVSAVPEAGEWAMMLLGLPLVGWVTRRK
jgi:hypothetical protein